MKSHTNGFKTAITEMGRQLRGIITYGNTTLEDEIYSITPHYQGNLLKSIMKQLDLELSVDIPLETEINCQIGILVNDNYEMLDFGNYIVYNSEKQEDTNTYKITCYDKMLYAMKKNEDLEITYPIMIVDYLTAIANKIGLTVASNSFFNQTMTIPSELYLGLDYTYRDILDEIAQVTGSIIYINADDELEVRYPINTYDTIDEDFLKDVNVEFGQKYGPINSIVLSRAGESDNVYLRDEDSVAENGLCEVKIVDNQIMNFNNRSDFLPGILQALNGLYYYINDFSSPGILYYEVGDLYNVQVGETTYQCLMLNDEINVTTGIEELIHTDLSEHSETDYEKADKTDMRINQTYLIVDKQNQTIESVITNVGDQNEKISQITQTVDELNSKIQDIADITTYGESDRGVVELQDINESEPIMIKVHPTTTNISYLHPKTALYPSDTQYLSNRSLMFIRTYDDNGTTRTEYIPYELPDDLLIYNSNVYDEFYLDYDSQTCQVTKRCEYNADGTVSALGTEVTTSYPYPQILLGEGDYQVLLYGYDYGYLYVRLMAQNIYTSQFYTKVETDSKISQTADNITLMVSQVNSKANTNASNITTLQATANGLTSTVENLGSQTNTNTSNISTLQQTAAGLTSTVATKVGNNEVISKINQSAEAVTINANKININGTISANGNFKVETNGNLTAKGGTIAGWTITGAKLAAGDGTNEKTVVVQAPTSSTYWAFAAGGSSHNSYSDCPFRVDKNGNLYATSANITGTVNATSGTFSGTVNATNGTFQNCTVTNSCTVPASTITGTLATNNIPNLSAGKITTGTLNGNNVNVTNLSASNINTGTLNGRPITNGSITGATYKFQGNYECIAINKDDYGAIEGYYTNNGTLSQSTRRYSLVSFTNGGRFQTFDYNGYMAAYFNHQGASATISDKKDKQNIQNIDIEESINIIKNLKPVNYKYKKTIDNEQREHRGLIAQDVEKALNDIGIKNQIYEINEDGRYLLNYVELIPDLINCIKYLNQKIEKLEKEGK